MIFRRDEDQQVPLPGYESVKRFEANPSRGMIPPPRRESPRSRKGRIQSAGGPCVKITLPLLPLPRHVAHVLSWGRGMAYDPSHGGG